jgi:hypothetical protein
LARYGFYHDGPLPDRPLRHESCRDIRIVRRESLGNRLVGGFEDEGGAVDRSENAPPRRSSPLAAAAGASFKWASR